MSFGLTTSPTIAIKQAMMYCIAFLSFKINILIWSETDSIYCISTVGILLGLVVGLEEPELWNWTECHNGKFNRYFLLA